MSITSVACSGCRFKTPLMRIAYQRPPPPEYPPREDDDDELRLSLPPPKRFPPPRGPPLRGPEPDSFGRASLTRSCLPSSSKPSRPAIAASALSRVSNSMNPKPRDFLVSRSVAIDTDMIVPNSSKQARRAASVVLYEMFPMYSFISNAEKADTAPRRKAHLMSH